MSARDRDAKGRRLLRTGRVHAPTFAITRVVQGDTAGPYQTTAIYCGATGWTGRCDCKDGLKWIIRGERPKLDKGEGCSHLRIVRVEGIRIMAEEAAHATMSTVRRRLCLDSATPLGVDR